jgi:hypothetical protein
MRSAHASHRPDDQPIAITVHDCFIARQLKLDRNADRLVAAIAEQIWRAFVQALGWTSWHMPETYARIRPNRKRPLDPAVECPVSHNSSTG